MDRKQRTKRFLYWDTTLDPDKDERVKELVRLRWDKRISDDEFLTRIENLLTEYGRYLLKAESDRKLN